MYSYHLIKNFSRAGDFVKHVHVRKKSYTSVDYCLHLVRSLDNENYFCTLLLASQMRTAALAVRAFNVEVASVQDQVSQPQLGIMRLKFWEETIEKIYSGKVPNNPVAVELAKAVHKHKISKTHLKKLITCRSRRFDQPSFTSIREMETYADASCGSVLLLLLQIAGVNSVAADHVANHLGKAQGLANLLRGIPHCVSKRTLSLPSDLLSHYGIAEESVFRGKALDDLPNVVMEVASSAFLHLIKARRLSEEIPLEARKVFLPAIPTERYLLKLKSSSYNVFDSSLQIKSPLLPVRLFINSLFGRY